MSCPLIWAAALGQKEGPCFEVDVPHRPKGRRLTATQKVNPLWCNSPARDPGRTGRKLDASWGPRPCLLAFLLFSILPPWLSNRFLPSALLSESHMDPNPCLRLCSQGTWTKKLHHKTHPRNTTSQTDAIENTQKEKFLSLLPTRRRIFLHWPWFVMPPFRDHYYRQVELWQGLQEERGWVRLPGWKEGSGCPGENGMGMGTRLEAGTALRRCLWQPGWGWWEDGEKWLMGKRLRRWDL